MPASAATAPARRSPAAAARSRRLGAAACVLPVIALGLGARFLGSGPAADLAGGVLYAVLVYVLATFLRPRAGHVANALAALVFCVLIELLQLTDIPADLAAFFPPVRLVLGTTFVPLDLLAYGLGTALALGVDLVAGYLLRARGARATAA
ncbi:ribosomal maturation YjgA family protein [Paeniglutamicibacter psychrophenolicus]|uniref:ribosomal maturation YjgA family protein n=1 Tax=Paeniglutamicibacter psychrophenolicus TaxID=257454 RepID=UPI00278AA30F|nr:DUF2809 domain-containing protein [Paeniglutamicibacter psychrophenolicus]MDQ0094023.1 hypothetical protein [Paeniglutamicibacter psychrophenolicus]